MRTESKISESTDIVSILLGLVGVGVAILVTKVSKELTTITDHISYSTLQNTYQLVYNQIPANATDIQSTVNATYFYSLSNLHYATYSIIKTYAIAEYSLYFIGFILLLALIIKLVKFFKS